MAFENVQPGDAWRPEPAARYNAVNDLLNRTAAPTEARQTRLGDHRGALIVLGEVPSGAVVEQYAPVYLGSGAVVQGGADRADVVFPLAEAGDVWGIAQQSASGGVVSVCLQGLTPVRVSGGAIAPGTRLAPTSGGYLASAALGDARALQTHNVASGGTIIAQLTPDMAGGGGGYESYFTLTWDSANNIVTIADGATGGDSVAVANGWDLYTLAPKSFAITNNYYLFYLKYTPAKYNSAGSLISSASMSIEADASPGGVPSLPSGDGSFYVQLGRLLWVSGAPKIVQDFTGGVADVRWYIKCG